MSSDDLLAEDSSKTELVSFPTMGFYAVMSLNPVAALKDLDLGDDTESMDEAIELQKSMSFHLVYIMVSIHPAHICAVPFCCQLVTILNWTPT